MVKNNLEIEKARLSLERKIDYYFSEMLHYPFCPPEHVYFSLTNRCNLRCKMCSIPNSQKGAEDELSTAECKNIITQIAGLNREHLILSGGEPLLRDDIFDLIRHAVNEKIKMVDIITNGVLIDGDVAKRLISSGLNHITISIDGLNETGDYIRGIGITKKSLEAIGLLNEYKQGSPLPTVGINFTIMDCNVDHILPMVRLAKERKCNIIVLQPMMTDNTNMQDRKKNELWVKEENIPKLKEVMREVLRLKKTYHDFSIHVNNKLLKLIPYYFAGKSLGKKLKCYEGIVRIVITCSGDLWSCRGSYGNLRKQTLNSCWYSDEAKNMRQLVKQCKNHCLQSCVQLFDLYDIYSSIERFYAVFAKRNQDKSSVKELLTLLSKYKALLEKEEQVQPTKRISNSVTDNNSDGLTSEIAKMTRIIAKLKQDV